MKIIITVLLLASVASFGCDKSAKKVSAKSSDKAARETASTRETAAITEDDSVTDKTERQNDEAVESADNSADISRLNKADRSK